MASPTEAALPGVYPGARPALVGANLVSSEEPRCLQCDSMVLGCYHPWNYRINPFLGIADDSSLIFL